MTIAIKHRFSDAVLFSGDFESIKAALVKAVEQKVDLQGASLQGADLRGADLQGASLRGASLQGAELQGAKNLDPALCTPLLMLLDQPPTSKLRAYKLVDSEGYGPFNGGVKYVIGKTVKVDNANEDPNTECGAGVNVATLDWCLKNWEPTRKILIVEFTREDIAAIPTASDGKFRLHKCKVIGVKKLDYDKIFPKAKS